MEKKKIIVVGAYPDSVAAFRGDLIRELAGDGHCVTVMTAEAADRVKREIEGLGESGQWPVASGQKVGKEEEKNRENEVKEKEGEGECVGGVRFRAYSVQRNGLNAYSDLKTLRELRKAFGDMQPDVVLAYTIKPIIWGGMASRVLKKGKFYALVTGLGYAFQGGSFKRRLLSSLVTRLYRFALRYAKGVIFQNTDNRDLFVERKIVPASKCHVVGGSGVNTRRFAVTEFPRKPEQPVDKKSSIHFLLIARLLGEKGIREYAKAAAIVKEKYPAATFSLVGPEDPSPDGIPIEEVHAWHQIGQVHYHGSTSDVRPFLENCHVYVLPSYHEGMPRTVLEAMAIGRPILTTHASGCKDTVETGVNGWLVPTKDPKALAEKMIWFIENPDRLIEMAKASRRIAEENFDVEKVNGEMIRILGLNSELVS